MLSMTSLKAVSAVALAASALLVGAASAAPAFATTTAATYGTWGEPTEVTPYVNYTGTVSFGTSGISDATYDTTFDDNDSYNEVSLDVNTDEYLTAETPFGAVFGASGPSDTTNFMRADVHNSETTVITFDTPVPANRLGLAVGDLDLDTAVISATDGSGTPLTDTQLFGSSTTNAFNLCVVTTSLPPECEPDGTYTEAPLVTSAAHSVTFGFNVVGEDVGVTGWIYPSADIKTLTILHTNTDSDRSSIRVWLAAIDEAAPVLPNTAAPEAGATLWIALALGLLGMGGLVAANRRKVNA